MAKRYTVTYERDHEANVWVAVIDRAQGVSCVTQGRSIGEARKRIREALALYLDDDAVAEAAELVDDVKLPARAKSAVAKALKAREAAERAQELALEASAASARELAAAGVSTRDAAEMLGLSHQAMHKYALMSRADAERVTEVTAVSPARIEGGVKGRRRAREKPIGERLRAPGEALARRANGISAVNRKAQKRK